VFAVAWLNEIILSFKAIGKGRKVKKWNIKDIRWD
jgi:hypothetical protein